MSKEREEPVWVDTVCRTCGTAKISERNTKPSIPRGRMYRCYKCASALWRRMRRLDVHEAHRSSGRLQ